MFPPLVDTSLFLCSAFCVRPACLLFHVKRKQTWCSPWLRPIDGMAARLRADADNRAGSLGRNLQTLKVFVSAKISGV